jgi:hypothetical protein
MNNILRTQALFLLDFLSLPFDILMRHEYALMYEDDDPAP